MKILAFLTIFLSAQSFASCQMGYYKDHELLDMQAVCYYDVWGSEMQLIVSYYDICPTTYWFC